MAHQTLRVNLAAVMFPFTKEQWGRSIMNPQYDENYERMLVSSADIGKDKGVAIACYLHNCMPTTEGYQAIGYTQLANGVTSETAFDRVFPLIQTSPNPAKFLFSPAGGKNYIYDGTIGGWASTSAFPAGTIGDKTRVSVAYVQGQTYIFFEKIGCYTYDQVNKVLSPVALAGVDVTTIIGITASFGYMIAWNDSQVIWSNATNPTDFTPSLITGAGGGPVNDIKGRIIYCAPIPGGFVCFCEKNAVGARYSGNIRFPFVFKEIPNSGGIASQDQIALNHNAADTYAYTSAGIQQFSLAECKNMFVNANDFLAKNVYEDFDDVHLQWTETPLATPMSVKVSIVGNRFLVFSYGLSINAYTYALVYDSTLERWGKVKVNHVACFQWNTPNLFGSTTYGELGVVGMTYGDLANTTYGELASSIDTPDVALKTFAFLQQDGTVVAVDFDYGEGNANGTLLLGKYQFMRNKFITHQYSEAENVPQGQPFVMYVIPTIDGKTFLDPVLAVKVLNGQDVQRWAKRVTGKNYSLLFQGAFNLVSVLTDFTLQGDW